MRTRDILALVLFGVSIRYLDTILELLMTYLGNVQAEQATMTQVKINNMVENSSPMEADTVVHGFLGDSDE